LEKLLKLEITSPDRIMYSGMVSYVIAPAKMGEIEILFNHADLVSILGIGRIVVKDEKGEVIKYAASGGIIEVKKNTVSILAEEIEKSDEIDVNASEAKISKANEDMKVSGNDKDELLTLIQIEKNKIKIANS
jgi:F-type H+-transporting ATPase subunit epsilon